MSEDDPESKTEEATSKHLDEARKEGNVLQSQEVKTAVMLLGILVIIWLMAPGMGSEMQGKLGRILANAGTTRTTTVDDLQQTAIDLSVTMALVLLKPMLLLLALGVIAAIGQTGWLVVPKRIMPDLNKLNPLNAMGRIFSVQGLVDLVKNVAKMGLVGAIAYMILRPHLSELAGLASVGLSDSLLYLHHLLVRLIFAVLLTVLVMAGADWFWQRYSYYKKMRMSKQEVKDEHKQTEGDPIIKGRLRALRMQRARARMMAAVPKADVVVTNPTHYACALKYDQASMNAPVLIAKGQDLVALRIRQVAEEHDIPIVENPPLARALYATVELDKEIPPDHYKAVAEVITYVMRIKGKFRR